jgi:hypothetical protein
MHHIRHAPVIDNNLIGVSASATFPPHSTARRFAVKQAVA